MGLKESLRFVLGHPLNKGDAGRAILRVVKWQLGSRLLPGPVVVDFVAPSQLIVAPGQHGATAHIYAGLGEFEEMAFVGHFLRPEDLFVDVGANIGAYTVLAAGATGARVIAIEPGLEAFRQLGQNVRLNALSALVSLHQVALGDRPGSAFISTGMDTMNHIQADAGVANQPVELTTLDALLMKEAPVAIKIDVEGYEMAILRGSPTTLADSRLKAIIVELNGSGIRYGYTDNNIHETLLSYGFTHCSYEPFTRKLSAFSGRVTGDNRLYVRDKELARTRVASAAGLRISGGRIV